MDTNAFMGWSGMGTSFLGSLTSVFGDIAQGQDEKKMYDYQAGVARMNAQISEQNAKYASDVGELQAGQAGLRGAATLGMIKATQGSHGLDVRSGSAAQVQQSQSLINVIDQTAIRSGAAKTAFNYRNMAAAESAQAGADVIAGDNAAAAGTVKAATSIIGGASSVDQQWLQGQKAGLWGNNSNQTFGGSGGIGMM